MWMKTSPSGWNCGGCCDALHAGDFRQDLDEQIGFVQQPEGAAGAAFGEHFGQLVAHALAADGVNARRERRMAASVAGSMV